MTDRPPPLPYAAPTLTPVVSLQPSVSPVDVPRELAAASLAWRPIGRAVRYANFDATSLAVFALLSAVCSIGGVVGFLLAAVLAWTAFVEFRAVRQLRRLDPLAPRTLAFNQLVLGTGIVLYSLWNLAAETAGHGLSADLRAHQDQLGDLGPQAAALFKTFTYALYGLLALLGVLLPGATAWFYQSRAKHLRSYLATTPDWIRQMQRERGSLALSL